MGAERLSQGCMERGRTWQGARNDECAGARVGVAESTSTGWGCDAERTRTLVVAVASRLEVSSLREALLASVGAAVGGEEMRSA